MSKITVTEIESMLKSKDKTDAIIAASCLYSLVKDNTFNEYELNRILTILLEFCFEYYIIKKEEYFNEDVQAMLTRKKGEYPFKFVFYKFHDRYGSKHRKSVRGMTIHSKIRYAVDAINRHYDYISSHPEQYIL